MKNRSARDWVLNFASFAVAFSSLIQELVLAQALAATLGNTLLRYSTTIGLFGVALGAGAFSYSRWRGTFRAGTAFVFLQLLLVVCGALGPAVVHALDPLGISPGESAFWGWTYVVLSYAPILVVGYISGFELPLLMDMASTKRAGERVLASDYLGMFCASLAFPLLFLPQLGVFGSAMAASACNLSVALIFALVFGLRADSAGGPVEANAAPANRSLEEPSLGKHGALALILLTAFCSMCYELLIAKVLVEFSDDDVLNQSWTIGSYLLGMGIGTWWCSRRPAPKPMARLLRIECALTVFGGLAAVLIYAIGTYAEVYWHGRLALLPDGQAEMILSGVFQPLAIFIGALSGYELPLLMAARGLRGERDSGRPLAFAYAGGLVASFCVPLLLIPRAGTLNAFVVVALLNFVCCVLLVRPSGLRWISPRIAWLALASLALAVAGQYSVGVRQNYLKVHYFGIREFRHSLDSWTSVRKTLATLRPVRRIETPYQAIDIIDENAAARAAAWEPDYTLFLNKQPQFSRMSWAAYHEAFAHGSIHLHGSSPRDVLILGGGDGLLAGELLRDPGVGTIKLVELDPKMIELARTEIELTRMNRWALRDARVEVIIDDAFKFVRAERRRFDAVYMDFPYPTSFDLLRLFSREFYQNVARLLKPGGFVVLDAPIWKGLDEPGAQQRPRPDEVLLSTLDAAGFRTLYPYGPLDPLIYAQIGFRKVGFQHEKLPSFLSHRGFMNMNDLFHLTADAEIGKKNVNTIFRPKRFD